MTMHKTPEELRHQEYLESLRHVKDPALLRQAVLRALAETGTEQDLAAIHTLMNRPQKDISLLPIVGGLVSGGFIEKVTSPKPSAFPNAPVGSSPGRRGSQPVRFRLTDQGRELLTQTVGQVFQVQAASLEGAEAGEDDAGE